MEYSKSYYAGVGLAIGIGAAANLIFILSIVIGNGFLIPLVGVGAVPGLYLAYRWIEKGNESSKESSKA
ncbi:hypothetical protein HNQ80_001289 [Anaerosolibacter carboniphilus]|uniref:Uncharacterized protein n=1 Tax=Anaerosolibacter carboniphilus TaxID=1417629 RepID=A0A841KT43_9FIRM|nr:hypothetical protein [Anaerosolibacter carboniphilus]MBB6215200.1 hypothetical protein [Anaerosolibacter carboniphilus]